MASSGANIKNQGFLLATGFQELSRNDGHARCAVGRVTGYAGNPSPNHITMQWPAKCDLCPKRASELLLLPLVLWG